MSERNPKVEHGGLSYAFWDFLRWLFTGEPLGERDRRYLVIARWSPRGIESFWGPWLITMGMWVWTWWYFNYIMVTRRVLGQMSGNLLRTDSTQQVHSSNAKIKVRQSRTEQLRGISDISIESRGGGHEVDFAQDNVYAGGLLEEVTLQLQDNREARVTVGRVYYFRDHWTQIAVMVGSFLLPTWFLAFAMAAGFMNDPEAYATVRLVVGVALGLAVLLTLSERWRNFVIPLVLVATVAVALMFSADGSWSIFLAYGIAATLIALGEFSLSLVGAIISP